MFGFALKTYFDVLIFVSSFINHISKTMEVIINLQIKMYLQ